MSMDIRSLTSLAEWVDFLHTRMAAAFGPDYVWWVELHPAPQFVVLKVRYMRREWSHSAHFYAIEKGAPVSVEALATAADFHIDQLKGRIVADQD